jgi:Domain of unknown function (DUF4397)
MEFIMEDRKSYKKNRELHMRNNRQQFIWGSLALFCLAIGGWRCSKAGSSQTTTAATYIAVINAASYGPSADIYLNGTVVSSDGGVAPGTYSHAYGTFAPGNYEVQFDKTGTDSVLYDIPSSAYDTASFYTLILYNASPGGTGVIDAAKITDNFGSTSQTTANYRFFNLSPDVPSCDLYLNGTLVQIQRTPADNVSNILFDEFQTLAPNSYTIVAKVSGGDSVLATTTTGVDLSTGNVFTIFLSGTNTARGNNLTINVMQAIF